MHVIWQVSGPFWKPHCASCAVSLYPGSPAYRAYPTCLIDSNKGKPLVTNARLEAVWKRLADSFATVVANISMIVLSPEYAAQFYDICIDGNDNAKMINGRMKMLMFTLSFMVRHLIAPASFK